MVAELVVCVQESQEVRAGRAHCAYVSLEHRVEHKRGADTLRLRIEGVESIDLLDIDRLHRIGNPHLYGAEFQFFDETSAEPLAHGVLLLSLLLRLPDQSVVQRSAQLRRVYAEPAQRRKALIQYNWDNSVVAPADRALVEDLIVRVYNMYELMPSDMRVFLEPIERANYVPNQYSATTTHAASTATRKRTATSATTAVSQDVLGYTLHFSGVPDHDESFLRHLESIFGKRLVAAIVVFPHERLVRKSKVSLMPAELLISLACEGKTDLTKQYALIGSKRLCAKVYSALETTPVIASTATTSATTTAART
jgi:hypothetical protein